MKISIAGLGVVGGGLVALSGAEERLRQLDSSLEIYGVCARDQSRDRGFSIADYTWFDDPVMMAKDPQTDIFVELIGGSEGPAKDAVIAALRAGKHVVTANKALIAEHGHALAELAEANNVALKFEAAVAGGTPIVSGLKSSLVACKVSAIRGILNGTCNYILSEMSDKGIDFDVVLKEAQRIGFAEADPSFDVDGIDAAHKIVILANLGFDTSQPFALVMTSGITDITLSDIRAAETIGYKIKLIAEAIKADDKIGMRVTPALVPSTNVFAQTAGAENIISVDAAPLGTLRFIGPGAGAGATAAAVAADIFQITQGHSTGAVFTASSAARGRLDPLDPDDYHDPYFLHFTLKDHPEAITDLDKMLKAAGLVIDRFGQMPPQEGISTISIVTQNARATRARQFKSALNASPHLASLPCILPIISP